jgi:hypothetical protein
MTKSIMTLVESLLTNATPSAEDVKGFTPHQMIHLLQELVDRATLSLQALRTLGVEYGVQNSHNAEIVYR